ncbi:hypothetical protein [Roseburia faecis]|jgi:hypothetical protein|uniref:Uncharacterized protein n=1 Tax=Roseburia faecis TaxID=301302 RepID=A0A173RDI2_9FIRM|nr:hypothetical protein [Roseburia faecis]CUM76020.1 Uncharacterised protein [Roseburia faecis]
MGLIDANALKEYCMRASKSDDDFRRVSLATLASVIDAQPIAYDVDKVVQQLEKLKSLVPVNRVLDDIVNEKPKELGMLMAYRKAIEIVKGGGVDAKTDF